jgi:thiol-disulfide isomerase/thioredoxin
MTKLIFVILAVFCMTFVVQAQSAAVSVKGESIVWEKDYKKALALAKETTKPLLLDFSASWCKPCHMMDEQFWTLSEVISAVQPFIAVKIDYDSNKGLVEKYGASAIPYVVFADPLGNMITSRRGFSKGRIDELNRIFDLMPKDFTSLKKYYDAIELKKDDGEALLKIADTYHSAKMYALSNEFYKRAVKTNEIKNNAEACDRVTALLGINAFTSNDFESAADYTEDYIKQFPAGKNRELAITVLALSNVKREKLKLAGKYLELLKTEFPASKNIQTVTSAIENANNKPVK